MIDWDASDTVVLLNPRLPAADAQAIHALIAAIPLASHVWVTTSGATGRLKPVALSRRALLASAAAVNAHVQSDAADVWVNVLPTFHVGGLGIHARAHLSGARVATLPRWDPAAYVALIAGTRRALSALVPTQLFDLVAAGLRAPASVRAVVVGGGALSETLYAQARALGWPVLPSYGATETCSQVATAELASLDRPGYPPLRALAHAELRTSDDGHLEIRSEALLTGYATRQGLEDPKRDGWWRSDDLGLVRGTEVSVLGRAQDVVKVGGELVVVSRLQEVLDAVVRETGCPGDAALAVVPDERRGAVLVLAVAGATPADADRLRAAYDARVLPFERAARVAPVRTIPRSALGKVVMPELRETLAGACRV